MGDEKNNQLDRRDLDLILEVNRKSVELETLAASQNEDIICELKEIADSSKLVLDLIKEESTVHDNSREKINIKVDSFDEKLDTIIKKFNDFDKSLFEIKILFATGVIGLIIQVVQLFLRK